MSFQHKALTFFLVFMIGLLAGAFLMLFSGQISVTENVEVRISEITRNTGPAIQNSSDNLTSRDSWFTSVSRDVTQSVVYIEALVPIRSAVPNDGNHDFDDNFWRRILPRQDMQTVGSGVIISNDGYIVTNNHVIGRSARSVRVGLHDKRYYEARIVGRDPSTDLAVLKIEANDIQPIVVGNSDYLEIGDWVMAVGNPFRLRSTVTAGIVSALNRDVDIIRDRMRIESFIQTDAAINKGNSGGALVNHAGELIGINTAIATDSGGYQGYGFAIPINMAFKIAMDLIEFGEVRRPYLGVQIASVEQDRASQLGLNRIQGVEILGVARAGSADKAGLRRNDVILAVNGFPVNEANILQERIAMLRPQDEVDLLVWRNGESIDKKVTLMSLNDEEINRWAFGENTPVPDFWSDETVNELTLRHFDIGFTIAEIPNPEEGEPVELTIMNVEDGSSAQSNGLQKDDIVKAINGREVESLQSFTDIASVLLIQNTRMYLTVEREDEERRVLLVYP